MRTMLVEKRSRYGRSCYLPASKAAQIIADIAGTTEVRTKDIELAARLGFTVIRVERTSAGLVDVETLAKPS